MVKKPLNILHVNTLDIGGGAEKIAWDLLQTCRARGLDVRLAVGSKFRDYPYVELLPLVSSFKSHNIWSYGWLKIANRYSSLVGKVRGAWKMRNLMRMIAQPRMLTEIRCGHEDFDFSGSWSVLDLPGGRPDILHCHNLHGGYFDLRALPWMSQQVPTIFTLHDMWMLSGHCSHSYGCERWETGCGNCPDLSIYPAIHRDATAYNWQRKQEIYACSSIYVATPSQWLMSKVVQSILAPAIAEAKVIPNGVNLAVFHPGVQKKARTALGIPNDARMLLHVGYSTKSSQTRDYALIEAAVKIVSERLLNERIVLVCLGEEQQTEYIGRAEIQFVSYQKDASMVAQYFQASDIYLHPAKVDNFPTVILEALACGTPVVATAVGGIPEQVKNGVTGFLVPSGDVEAMAEHIMTLLTDDLLYRQISLNAAQDARERFDLNRQVDSYVEWYQTIVEGRTKQA